MFRFFILFVFYTISHADLVIGYEKMGKEPTPNQNFEINKLKLIAKNNDILLTFKALPWKRTLLLLEKGLLDAHINVSYTPKRAKFLEYPKHKNKIDSSKRLNDGASYFIYKNRDSKLQWNGKKFINPDGPIAVRESYAVIKDLKKHKNITIKEFPENFEIVRALSNKQVSAYAANVNDIYSILKDYPVFRKSIKKEPIPIRKKLYYIVFSKKIYKNKYLEIEKIWLGLKKLNDAQTN